MSAEVTAEKLESILGQMSVEEKVGQCFTFGFAGSTIRRRHVEALTKLHCGGLRLTPAVEHGYGTTDIARPAPYLSPGEYTELLNKLQQIAAERRFSIPLIMSADQEGDAGGNINRGDVSMFPAAMGLASVPEPDFVYRVHRMVARQLRAYGINMIHSPVLDVNINPRNPEIGARSYSDRPEEVVRCALQSLKAFHEYDIIATGKHFPGRGDSDQDAHFSLPSLPFDKKRLNEVELRPFRELIKAGLDAVMTAHMRCPALDPTGEPATTSERMVRGVLRRELGFDGVVTTDSMAMLGIRELYGIPEASARAIKAGIDLVLLKAEGDLSQQCYDAVINYVKEGKITEERLNESVRRILRLKFSKGIFGRNRFADPSRTESITGSAEMKAMAREAAGKCLLVMKDDAKRIPIRDRRGILVIEQIHEFQLPHGGNDKWHHPGYFTERVWEHAPEADSVEIEGDVSDKKITECLERARRARLVLITDFGSFKTKTAWKVITPLVESGHEVIVVTASPYAPCTVPDGPSFVLTYSAQEESLGPAAELLFGVGKGLGRITLSADLTQKFNRVSYGTELNKKLFAVESDTTGQPRKMAKITVTSKSG